MTDQTNATPSPVTIEAGTQAMTFATHDVHSGQPLTAKEQHQARLANPQWVKDASVPGTPAYADRERLVMAMFADELRASGATPEEIAAELRAHGADPAQVPAKLQAAAAPAEVPPYYIPGGSDPLTPEAAEFDTNARGWLASAGFDAGGGNHLIERIMQLGRTATDWTDAQLEQHVEKGRAALRQVWGAHFDENVGLLDQLLEDVEKSQPGVIDFLDAYPWLINDPLVAQSLLSRAMSRYRLGG